MGGKRFALAADDKKYLVLVVGIHGKKTLGQPLKLWYSIFGFSNITSFEGNTCIGDTTTSLRFQIKKAITILSSDFLLVPADGGRLLCWKVSTQTLCKQSNEALFLHPKLSEIYYCIWVKLIFTLEFGKISCAFKTSPKSLLTQEHSAKCAAADP